MNVNQAKAIRLEELLERLGYDKESYHRGRTEVFYKSPFRDEEKDPSFSLNVSKNVYYDFGESHGGNTLDFAIRYLESRGEASSVKDALQFLRNIYGSKTSSYFKPRKKISSTRQKSKVNTSKLELINVAPIKSNMIVKYLSESRRLSKSICKQYLVEVQYRNTSKSDKIFNAIGIKNLSNGYELRSYSDEINFQSAINRDLSFIEAGSHSAGVMVFESFIDALSALDMLENVYSSDVLILNSISTLKKAIDFINNRNYTYIHTFMDNDKAGKKALRTLKEEFKSKVFSQEYRYENFKDVNDAHKEKVNIFLNSIPEI